MWAEDIEGHPTLPFSVAARLLLPPVVVRDDRGASLFSQFVTDQLLDRVWSTVIPHLNLEADDIFSAVVQAAEATTNKTPLVSVAGDWADSEGVDVHPYFRRSQKHPKSSILGLIERSTNFDPPLAYLGNWESGRFEGDRGRLI